jgi:type I restriction enzyme, S subunit
LSLITPKKKCKSVPWLFGEAIEIPKSWDMVQLGKLCLEKPQYGANEAALEKDQKLPRYIRITDIKNNGKLKDEVVSILEENSKSHMLKEGDFLFARTGSVGRTYRYKKEDGRCAFAGYLIKFKPNPEKLNIEFLFQYTQSYYYHRWLLSEITHGVQPNVNAEQYSKMPIILPSVSEQQKIATILSNVDNLIETTSKIIKNYKSLKTGMMQKLLTRGIGHTKFKNVNLGKNILDLEIPEIWSVKKFKDILEISDNKIDLDDNKKYVRIIVKRRHDGVVLRDIIYGKDILTKNQYGVKTGQFIISRRQIIHNACFIIPEKFNNAVVSNEYSIFSGSSDLDINYLDLFSQTSIFKKTIILTTHGVHIEKFLFLLNEWLQLSLPLPKIHEQRKIMSIFSNLESKVTSQEQYKEKLEKLKKSLMQKLLTGEVRV